MIIFLHGRLSTPETSRTAQMVKEYFEARGEDVLIPDYKPTEGTFADVEQFLAHYIHKNAAWPEETIIMGISLGGYWAVHMANMMPEITKCLVLNPSMRYYGEWLEIMPDVPVGIYLNKDDELINSEYTLEHYKGKCAIKMFEHGGHRMTNIEEVLPEIEKGVNAEWL